MSLKANFESFKNFQMRNILWLLAVQLSVYIVGISDYSDIDNEAEYCSISSKFI